jgi:hypothetical protein
MHDDGYFGERVAAPERDRLAAMPRLARLAPARAR